MGRARCGLGWLNVTDCYYRRAGTEDGHPAFDSTALTGSNWGPQLQHGSPPLALLTRAVEELIAGTGMRIGRLSLDILGAIPVGRVHVSAEVQRPGRRICLVAAEMFSAGRVVARLNCWALATTDTADVATDRHEPLVQGPPQPPPDWLASARGYIESVQWSTHLNNPDGTAVAWLRPEVALIDGEEPTALQRLAMVVDSANGVGAALDMRTFSFMNTDTVVHLHRLPIGADFGLQARASIGPDGIGVTTAEIFDRTGFIGTSAQTLLVQRR